MAAPMEALGSSLLRRSTLIPSSSVSLRGGGGGDESTSLILSSHLLLKNEKKESLCGGGGRRAAAVATAVRERRQLQMVVAERPIKFKVRAAVTVKRNTQQTLKEKVANQIDALSDKIGRSVVLELVSNDIDHRTLRPKTSNRAVLRDWFDKKDVKADRVVYTAEFTVDSGFGTPGAITVLNRHQNEFYLESIVVEGFASGPIHFPCNSWVQSTRDHPTKRVFFTNQPYVPSETPPGLSLLRQQELRELRGDGTGERKLTDRIYDYATYNDLGNTDKGIDFVRPTLGGPQMPYPRRCRTGRQPMMTDILAESRVEDPNPIYVPRDEAFEEGKMKMIKEGANKALLHNLMPLLVSTFSPENQDFAALHEVDNLFEEGIKLQKGLQDQLIKKLPFFSNAKESIQRMFRFETPHILTKDKFAWLRDDEFARQTLSGINPASIERLKVFPPVSKLDQSVYGPPESAIKEEHIISYLEGMSVQQALDDNKLFILDYHDAFLPFVDRINAQDGRKSYATRTIFFLTSQGTLKPVAIELSLPPATANCSRAKRVITLPTDATTNWIWQMAKAHVCSNDAGVHQLVNHWLRTHACIEPFILAAHRQLSVMHPIFKLLKPHMRYTLEINALARQILINADGIIENGFTPGSCGLEISSAFYRDHWRFDQEGLPADLIRRGMAVEDPGEPQGLKLLIEDYPYANDGLLIWSALEKWIHTYVETYYPTPAHVQSDSELQAWYTEVVHVGHADKCTEAWWPRLATPADLASILTTLVWLSSAQHAALNFGQYPLGGYIPNRPPLMRRLIPVEGDPEYEHFLANPQRFFLTALPALTQATTFMTVIDTLSTHSEDEQYIGERPNPYTWTGDAQMVDAFHSFAADMKRIEKEIDRRNNDATRRNRCGAGVLPYELMMPSSGPGITSRGVPNSISI